MIEIQNLAVAIRDTAALDAQGIVAAALAEDLADTNPDLIPLVFATARKRFKWLPKPVEMLDLYAEVVKAAITHADAVKQQADRDREDAVRRDREEHPENYFTFGQVVAEVPGAADFVAGLEKRDWQAKAQLAAQDNAPKIEECPGCGMKLPLRVADLRGLSIEDHYAYIAAKQARQEFIMQGAATARDRAGFEAANAILAKAKSRKPRAKKAAAR